MVQAMGTSIALAYANFYLYCLECNILDEYK